MAQFQANIDKERVAELPLAIYDGPIVVLDEDGISEETAALWNAQQLVGFDSESRPSFKKGEHNRLSLIQLACEHACYLIRLKSRKIPKAIEALFGNPEVMKVGLSSQDDFRQMKHYSRTFNPKNVVELQSYVKAFGIEDLSLQKIYAIVFGLRISKAQQLSNWEAEELSDAQQHYAALDAWACRQIYLRLNGKL